MEGNVRLLAFHPAGNEGVFLVKRKTSSAEIVGMASLFRCRLLSTHSGNEKISEIISRMPQSHGTYLLAPYVEFSDNVH